MGADFGVVVVVVAVAVAVAAAVVAVAVVAVRFRADCKDGRIPLDMYRCPIYIYIHGRDEYHRHRPHRPRRP